MNRKGFLLSAALMLTLSVAAFAGEHGGAHHSGPN